MTSIIYIPFSSYWAPGIWPNNISIFLPLKVGYGFNKRRETLSYLHYSSNVKGCKLKYLYGLSIQLKWVKLADIRQQGAVVTLAIYRVNASYKEGNCYLTSAYCCHADPVQQDSLIVQEKLEIWILNCETVEFWNNKKDSAGYTDILGVHTQLVTPTLALCARSMASADTLEVLIGCYVSGPQRTMSLYSQPCIVPSHTDSGLCHMACFSQRDISKLGATKGLTSLCSLGLVLLEASHRAEAWMVRNEVKREALEDNPFWWAPSWS